MRDENTLIVGIDLGNKTTQLCYYNDTTFEVETVCYDKENQTYMIPTVLAATADQRDWFFGEEAQRRAKEENGIVFVNFIEEAQENRAFLLEKFLRKVLMLLKRDFPNKSIKRLAITIRELELPLIEDIYKALEGLGINKDRAHVISHEQAYLSYALSRKKELWMNDVGLFEMDEHGLKYYQISIDRRVEPMLVGIQTKDFTQTLPYSYVEGNVEELQYAFKTIYETVLHKQVISTIYLTGPGFSEAWLGPCLNDLCAGRRVFIGENLYCFGACYAARNEVKGEGATKYAYLSNEALPFSVSMNLYSNGRVSEMCIIPTATPWYEVKRSFQVILDGEKELQFILRDPISHTATTRIIAVDGIETPIERSIRLEIRLESSKDHQLIVSVKDVGFGGVRPSTNRIWETIITA